MTSTSATSYDGPNARSRRQRAGWDASVAENESDHSLPGTVWGQALSLTNTLDRPSGTQLYYAGSSSTTPTDGAEEHSDSPRSIGSSAHAVAPEVAENRKRLQARSGRSDGLAPGRMALQERVLRSKQELHKSEADAQRYSQRLAFLEGDARGKVQWMIQWERLMATKGMDADAANAGPDLSWPTWTKFIDRSFTESQKTLRGLGRNLDLERRLALQSTLEEKARRLTETLQEAEARMSWDEDKCARLARMINQRKSGACDQRRGRRQALETLQLEIAAHEKERSRLQSEQMVHVEECHQIEGELAELCGELSMMPAQQHKRRLERAREQIDQLRAQMQAWCADSSACEMSALQQHQEDVSDHQMMIASLQAEHHAATREAEVLHSFLSESESSEASDWLSKECAQTRVHEMARAARNDAVIVRERMEEARKEQDCRRAAAALRIQRTFRGSHVWKDVRARRCLARQVYQREQLRKEEEERKRLHIAAVLRIQRQYRGMVGRRDALARRRVVMPVRLCDRKKKMRLAAILIQRVQRGRVVWRAMVAQKRAQQDQQQRKQQWQLQLQLLLQQQQMWLQRMPVAAVQIQRVQRGRVARDRARALRQQQQD